MLTRLDVAGEWEQPGPESDRGTGRSLSGWFHAEVAQRQPPVLEILQSLGQLRPYTLALVGRATPRLVLTGYGPVAPLLSGVADQFPDRLLLQGRWWHARGSPVVEHTTWSALAVSLLGPAPPVRARLAFVSPTTFRTGDVYTPLPAPELVFGSLLERWQRWSDIDLGASAREVVGGAIALRRFEVRSVLVRVPTFVGWSEWIMRPSPPEYSGLLSVLAAFAEFAGVGHGVQMGLGCVRRVTLPGAHENGADSSGKSEE